MRANCFANPIPFAEEKLPQKYDWMCHAIHHGLQGKTSIQWKKRQKTATNTV